MSSANSSAKCVQMPDSCDVLAVVISSEQELLVHLPNFISGARSNRLIVGFGTEWMYRYNQTLRHSRNLAKIAVLKLCNLGGLCLLIKLYKFMTAPLALVQFLAVRDVTFVGIDVSKQLDKLKEDYGLEMRTTLELTSVAAEKRSQLLDYNVCSRREGLDLLWSCTHGSERSCVDEELMLWLAGNPWGNFGNGSNEKQLRVCCFFCLCCCQDCAPLTLYLLEYLQFTTKKWRVVSW